MIIRGEQGVIEQPASYTQKEDGSGTTTRTFTAPTEALIATQNATLRSQGYATNISQGPGAGWTITATLAYNILTNPDVEPEPVPVWNFKGNAGEQNIMDTNLPCVTTLSAVTKERILQSLKNPGKNIPLIGVGSWSDELESATLLYNAMRLGADSRRFNTVTLSRTITVSQRYVCTWDLDMVGKVLSTSTLISSKDVPEWVSILLSIQPSSYIDKGNYIQAYSGWLEEMPTYSQVANNQVQISQEWVWNEWIVWPKYYEVIE
jgi:hypothetical protein